jgi:UDP-glucuronate 4-epimerase
VNVREPETVLVTGAMGFIGAWVVRRLLDDGDRVVAFDAAGDDYRLRYLLDDAELGTLTRVTGDITDRQAVDAAFAQHGVARIIHLAALQVPFCAADPPLGALVNVVGTVNVFEAAHEHTPACPVVYASSVAAYGGDDDGMEEASGTPSTHYGVFKRANEGNASVYWNDRGQPSIGLRPYVVYGVGRDRGLTSEPTVAMLRAARGEGHHIPYGGRSHFQYGADVAAAFVEAARSDFQGAAVFNLGGSVVDMSEVVAAIESAAPDVAGRISHDENALPFPPTVIAGALEAAIGPLPATPLADGVRDTVERFRALDRRGLLPAP